MFGWYGASSTWFDENSDTSWLPDSGVNLAFADLANFRIEALPVAALAAGWAGPGSGAPRESGSNVAYGVNRVFGDILSSHVSGDAGYIVANASVSAAPVPAAVWLFGSGLPGLVGVARRRAA